MEQKVMNAKEQQEYMRSRMYTATGKRRSYTTSHEMKEIADMWQHLFVGDFERLIQRRAEELKIIMRKGRRGAIELYNEYCEFLDSEVRCATLYFENHYDKVD